MSSESTAALALIHQKTQQRYPLRGDFVIGRSAGTLVFDHDPKLSSKHCLIRQTSSGFAIYDLKSRTGILINGTPLPHDKCCLLKAGVQITVGDQVFAVEQDGELPGRPGPSVATMTSIAGFLAVAFGLAFIFPKNGRAIPQGAGAIPIAQMQSVEAEMRESIVRYQKFAEHVRKHAMGERDSLVQLRQDLIPRFAALRNQLEAFHPEKPEEQARTAQQLHLSEIFLGQATAMANYLETKEPRYATQLADFNHQLEEMNAQVQTTQSRGSSRQPASTR